MKNFFKLFFFVAALTVTITANAYQSGTYTVSNLGSGKLSASAADPLTVCSTPAFWTAIAVPWWPVNSVTVIGDGSTFTCTANNISSASSIAFTAFGAVYSFVPSAPIPQQPLVDFSLVGATAQPCVNSVNCTISHLVAAQLVTQDLIVFGFAGLLFVAGFTSASRNLGAS